MTNLETVLTSPAVIAAGVAAWASITAAGLTWLSSRLSAATQEEAAKQQLNLEKARFQANLVLEAIKTGNPDQAAENMRFFIASGLITGDLATRLISYLTHRLPAEGHDLPSR